MEEVIERKKVGIWLRVSTQMQVVETDSLEHHQARAEAYCQAKEWDIVEIYKFEAVSGKKTGSVATLNKTRYRPKTGSRLRCHTPDLTIALFLCPLFLTL